METTSPDFAAGFIGDLAVEPGGAVSGWCADPARPALRCVVEILAEDRLAATLSARDVREDLLTRGFADPAHGFRVALPALALPDRPEVLIWARVRGARRGFAQRMLSRPERTEAPDPRVAALAREVATVSAALAGWSAPRSGGLAAFARPRGVDLPFVRAPSITLVVPVGPNLHAALDRLRAIAPVAWDVAAEVLAVGEALDTLPSLVPNLRLIQADPDLPRAIFLQARGDRVAILHEGASVSATVLAHVLRHGPPVLLAGLGGSPEWRVPGSPGLRAVVPRALLDTAQGWPGVFTRARAEGLTCWRLPA